MKKANYTTSTSYGDQQHQQEEEDRLSSLPDVLLIYILSFIDTKLSVQSSILSKRWVNLWTFLPVLNFNSSGFVNVAIYDLNFTFDYFIDKVLGNRNHLIKLDCVNLKVTDCNTIARVFRYAVTNGVISLSIDSSEYLTKYRPVSFVDCESEFLRSLSLKGMMSFGKFGTFGELVSLRLERVKIVESEPFSCFANLEELCLVNCKMLAELEVVEVICLRLTRLRISSCFHHPIPYKKIVLLTPKLVLFEMEGLIPMSFEAPELPVLEIVYIDCCFSFPRDADRYVHQPDEDEQKVNLIKILFFLRNAKYVHLSPSTVELLSLSQDKLVEESCPFGNLKVLNLIPPPNKPVAELHPAVAAYLLKGSPGVIVKSFPR